MRKSSQILNPYFSKGSDQLNTDPKQLFIDKNNIFFSEANDSKNFFPANEVTNLFPKEGSEFEVTKENFQRKLNQIRNNPNNYLNENEKNSKQTNSFKNGISTLIKNLCIDQFSTLSKPAPTKAYESEISQNGYKEFCLNEFQEQK